MQINADKEVPSGIPGWNWGAFFFTWIWGLANNTYIAFLSLIPVVHLVMMFVLGAKGNEWAWRNKDWPSVEAFHNTQRKWAIATLVCLGFLVIVLVIIPFALLGWGISKEMPSIKAMVNDFNPHNRYCNYALESSERYRYASDYLGKPIRIHGRIEAARHSNGYTEVKIPIRGSRAEGTIYLRTNKTKESELRLVRAELQMENKERLALDLKDAEDDKYARMKTPVNIEAATKTSSKWIQRYPSGHEEAEELFQQSIEKIKTNPEVEKVLGSNITVKVENAKVDILGSLGECEFRVILRDLNNASNIGLVDLKGVRSMGLWVFDGAFIELRSPEGNKTIRLLPEQN